MMCARGIIGRPVVTVINSHPTADRQAASHGPASVHTNAPEDKRIYPIINPWKHNPLVVKSLPEVREQKKMTLIGGESCCEKCHDDDNSVSFNIDKYWKQVAHSSK
jgi:hypothetical protein